MNQHLQLADEMQNYKVVYIEDDKNISETINEFLKRYFKTAYIANNAEDGMNLYKIIQPDIMIVDIELPGMSGLELISQIREFDEKTRIIITSAYTNKEFTLKAVELDITRYLDKPMTGSSILEALKKAIFEIQKSQIQLEDFYLGNGFMFNVDTKTVTNNNETIPLRKKEIQLLEFFMKNKGKVISYEVLQQDVWQDKKMTADAIRSQIKNIRQKLHPEIIKNVSGIGYTLNPNDDA